MTLLGHLYDTVSVWVAHRTRPDDGTCDECGDRRKVGYVRREVYRLRQYLYPEVGRYCVECAADLGFDTETEGDDA